MPTRINVTLSNQDYDELRVFSKKADLDMSNVVRNALRTYRTLKEEVLTGKRVYVGSENKVERELILP